MLTVEVDSREHEDIPPFGGNIDYLTFGGMYRPAALRVVPDTFVEDVFAKPANVLTEYPGAEASSALDVGERPAPP